MSYSMSEIKEAKVAVTGATGFVGMRLVNELLRQGAAVSVLVRNEHSGELFNEKDVNVVNGDLSQMGALRSLVKGADFLIHLAAYVHQSIETPEQLETSYQVNVQGLRNLVDACMASTNPPFIVYISSSSVYGESQLDLTEEMECNPVTVYGQQKLAAENYLKERNSRDGLPYCILRPSSILGEGAPGNIPKLVRLIDHGFYPVVDQGHYQKSLVYVDDVVAGILLACIHQNISTTQIFNISGNAPITILEICRVITETLQKKAREIHISGNLAKWMASTWDRVALLSNGLLPVLSRSIAVFTSSDVVSIQKITDNLGFQPKTSAVEGLIRTVRHLTEERKMQC